MEEMIGVVNVDNIPTTESESFSMTWVEEKNQEEVVSQATEVKKPRETINPNTTNPKVAPMQGE
jgi:hypothetical protein